MNTMTAKISEKEFEISGSNRLYPRGLYYLPTSDDDGEKTRT